MRGNRPKGVRVFGFGERALLSGLVEVLQHLGLALGE
jgi:hypothetical protein